MQDSTRNVHEFLARGDLDGAPIPEPERALLRYVEKVTHHAYKTTAADVETLRQQGWTEPQIAECVYITALFAFFNRVADAFGLEDPGYFETPPARGGDPIPPDEPAPP
ncbi:hypothetical protein BH23PLA1_BH23PLA1_44050 [soil metagenome]